jgi:hypothetical protein
MTKPQFTTYNFEDLRPPLQVSNQSIMAIHAKSHLNSHIEILLDPHDLEVARELSARLTQTANLQGSNAPSAHQRVFGAANASPSFDTNRTMLLEIGIKGG